MQFTSVKFEPFSMVLPGGRLVEVRRAQVMGILNATPDSFYSASRAMTREDAAGHARRLISSGADIIDVGACSTRPGAEAPSEAEEIERLRPVMKGVREVAPEMPVSVDTWRATVARAAVEEMGADIINDISGGSLDPDMLAMAARLHTPYILMHTRGTPATMASLCDYGERGVAAGVITEISRRLDEARLAGIADIILDPGFGFAKTKEQNYELLASLPAWREAFPGVPMLVGMSRKSMFKEVAPEDALIEATTAANTIALLGGAAIVRVHDPGAACAARAVVEAMQRNSQ